MPAEVTEPAALRLAGISCSVPGRPGMLADLDLRVDVGQRVAIVGPSGSGKSTLLGIAGLLRVPDHGVVEIGGRVVDSEIGRAAERAERVAWVLQSTVAFPDRSLAENVELALSPQVGCGSLGGRTGRRAAALDSLATVGLADRADTRARHVSGGELQRLGVARALVRRPAVVLADEPTASLDRSNADLVIEVLLRGLGPRGALVPPRRRSP